LPDYAQEQGEVEWKRPEEISPNETPEMKKEGVAPGDVK